MKGTASSHPHLIVTPSFYHDYLYMIMTISRKTFCHVREKLMDHDTVKFKIHYLVVFVTGSECEGLRWVFKTKRKIFLCCETVFREKTTLVTSSSVYHEPWLLRYAWKRHTKCLGSENTEKWILMLTLILDLCTLVAFRRSITTSRSTVLQQQFKKATYC